MAFGAQGHHLPGMMRAYGDTELYQRFRTRFIVAPILFFGLSAVCIAYDLEGLELIAYTWGIWHAAMQTYGFLRIYDAKAAALDPTRARWDFAMCAAWFIGGAIFSPLRLHYILHLATDCGAPVPNLTALNALRAVVAVAMAVAVVGALVQAARDHRKGIAFNVGKWALLVCSIAFWWFVNVIVRHPLLGLPLFELFHDVQYLSIVWQHMRRRLLSGAPMRTWLRKTLGRQRFGIAVYVALVLAYGILKDPFADGGTASRLAVGFFVASQLLHFYYDGFIWKMRDATTRSGLALKRVVTPAPPMASYGHHGVWAVGLLLLLSVLAAGQRHVAAEDTLTRAAAVSALVPDAATAWYALGEVRRAHKDFTGAVQAYEEALRRVPDYAAVQEQLGFIAVAAADEQLDQAQPQAAQATMVLAQGASTGVGQPPQRRGPAAYASRATPAGRTAAASGHLRRPNPCGSPVQLGGGAVATRRTRFCARRRGRRSCIETQRPKSPATRRTTE